MGSKTSLEYREIDSRQIFYEQEQEQKTSNIFDDAPVT